MIRRERSGAVERLTFDRPDRLNAFDGDSYRDLRLAVEDASNDTSVRVVVLTGAGRAFSAGADRSIVDGTASAEVRRRAGDEFAPMLDALARCEKPIIAAVNGVAVGIGATMLAYCDLVLVGGSVRLRFPFTALGAVPEAGSSAMLPARTRWPDLVWAMLSSEWIDADAAVAMGLAWRAVPDDELLRAADEAAVTIAAHDPSAVAATKRLLVEGRADAARAAIEREVAEMRRLFERRTAGGVTPRA